MIYLASSVVSLALRNINMPIGTFLRIGSLTNWSPDIYIVIYLP